LSPAQFWYIIVYIYHTGMYHTKSLFHYCVFSHCRENNVSTELFPSSGCYTVACLPNFYLAAGLHVRIIEEPLIKIINTYLTLKVARGTWLRRYATSRKVAGSIPNEFIAFFN
jgi:hypothetical protein